MTAGRAAAIPTTLSGAEMTPFHRLPAGVEGGRMVRPALVVADPDLMASQPGPARAASAMNALAHAVESLYTPLANPVATLAALHAAELLGHDEPETLAVGALLAGYASGQAGFAVHHVVCQTLVRLGGTPHAQTNAVILPHVVRLMTDRAPDQIAALARALGGDDASALIERLAERAQVSGLRALGFQPRLIPDVIDAVLANPALGNTPRPPGRSELEGIIDAAL